MKRKIKKFFSNWKTRKYLALLIVLILALIGVKITPDGNGRQLAFGEERSSDEDKKEISENEDQLFQYPVELGYPVDYNYNGGPSVDFMKKTFVTENAKKDNIETEESEAEDDNESQVGINIADDNYKKLHSSFGDIYCSNSGDIAFKINNSGNAGISKATVMHADKIGYIIDGFSDAKYSVENNFYGKITFNCIDNNGKASKLVSQYILVENGVPSIQISEGDVYDAPGTVDVEVTDAGKIVSGIYEDSIECYINDNKFVPKNVESIKKCRLADNLDVSTDTTFTMEFPKDGNYDIQISVSDNCGNTAKFKYFISVVNNMVIIS